MTDTDHLRLALDEMRRSYDLHSANADRLDQKAAWLLNSSSIVLGLFAFLNLSLLDEQQSWTYWITITLALIGYGVLVWACSTALSPQVYVFPVPANWDAISQGIIGLPIEESLTKLLSTYVEYIPRNGEFNSRKASRVRIATLLLPAIVILVFLASILPR